MKHETLGEFESIYRYKIISTLNNAAGCLFAGLLQSIDQVNRFISLTLWKSKRDIHKYIDDGTFQENLDLVTPYMEESSEWKIQLTQDDILNYESIQQEPIIKSYSLTVDTQLSPESMLAGKKYLRVLSLKLMPEKKEEFKMLFNNKIKPELKKVTGCRYSFLIDNYQKQNEMLSFTIWDDLHAVERYEQQGKFRALLGIVQHTLAELYQWKMSLENDESPAISVSSRDIDISKFTLVAGEKFK